MEKEEENLSMSLEEAQEYALQHNVDAINEKLDIQYAKAQVKEYTAAGLPQISAKAQYQYYLQLPGNFIEGSFFPPVLPLINPMTNDTIPYQLVQAEQPADPEPITFGTDHNLTAGLSVNQLIFSGSYFTGLKLAREVVKLSEEEVILKEIETKNKVAQSYYSALIVQENKAILEKNAKTLDRILFETTQLYENGFAEALDVDRLTLSSGNLQAQIRNMERQERLALDALKLSMGMPLESELLLSGTIDDLVANAKFEKEALDNLTSENRIEFTLLDIQERMNDLDIQLVRSGYLPTFAAFFNAQYIFQSNDLSDLNNENRWIPSSFAGLSLDIPIFDGFKKRGQVQQRLVNRQKIKNGRTQLKQALSLELKSAITEYEKALDDVETQQKNLELAEKIYNTVLIKYKEGLGSSLEVTNAETELYNTQSLYVNSLYNLLVAKTKLERASGQ